MATPQKENVVMSSPDCSPLKLDDFGMFTPTVRGVRQRTLFPSTLGENSPASPLTPKQKSSKVKAGAVQQSNETPTPQKDAVRKLQHDLKDALAKNMKLEEERREVEKELRAQLEAATAERDQLTREGSAAKKVLASLKGDSIRFQTESEEARTRAETAEAMAAQLASDKESALSTVKELREAVAEKDLRISELEEQSTQWESKCRETQDELTAMRGVLCGTREEGEKHKRAAFSATAAVAAHEQQLKQERARSEQQRLELAKKDEEIAAFTNEVEKLREQSSKLQEQARNADVLRHKMGEKEKKCQYLQDKVEQLEQMFADARKALDDMQKEAWEKGAQLKTSERALLESQRNVEDLKAKFLVASDTVQDLGIRLDELQAKNEECEQEREQLTQYEESREELFLSCALAIKLSCCGGSANRSSAELYEEARAENVPISMWGVWISEKLTSGGSTS